VVRSQFERLIKDMDVATREEVEVLREMVTATREENEKLEARVKELEAKLSSTAGINPATP